jgi:ketosteroid isomerase-like protein
MLRSGGVDAMATLKHIALLGVALFAAAGDRSSAAESAAREIAALEETFNRVQLQGDAAGLGALLADDYVSIYADGTVYTKKDWLSWFDKSAPREKRAAPEDLATENESVRIFGDTAIVVLRLHEKGSFFGQPYEARGRATDVWIRRGDHWVLVLTHESHFPDHKSRGEA